MEFQALKKSQLMKRRRMLLRRRSRLMKRRRILLRRRSPRLPCRRILHLFLGARLDRLDGLRTRMEYRMLFSPGIRLLVARTRLLSESRPLTATRVFHWPIRDGSQPTLYPYYRIISTKFLFSPLRRMAAWVIFRPFNSSMIAVNLCIPVGRPGHQGLRILQGFGLRSNSLLLRHRVSQISGLFLFRI